MKTYSQNNKKVSQNQDGIYGQKEKETHSSEI